MPEWCHGVLGVSPKTDIGISASIFRLITDCSDARRAQLIRSLLQPTFPASPRSGYRPGRALRARVPTVRSRGQSGRCARMFVPALSSGSRDARIFATHRRCSCGARRPSRHLLRGDRLPRVRFVPADAADAVRQPRSRCLQASAWHGDQSCEPPAIRVRAGHFARLDRAAPRNNGRIGAETAVRGGQDKYRAKNEAPKAAAYGAPERTAQSTDGLCVPAVLRWLSIVVLEAIPERKAPTEPTWPTSCKAQFSISWRQWRSCMYSI